MKMPLTRLFPGITILNQENRTMSRFAVSSVCAMLLGGCVTGCERQYWADVLKEDVLRVESNFRRLESQERILRSWHAERLKGPHEDLGGSLGRVDAETREVFYGNPALCEDTREAIYGLWAASGNCLFLDLYGHQIMSTIITKRYRAFYRRFGHLPRDQVLRMGLPGTIAALETEYCGPALIILAKYVSFSPVPTYKERFEWIKVPPERRPGAYDAMRKWYDDNARLLTWNARQGMFDHNGKPFALPDAVSRAEEPGVKFFGDRRVDTRPKAPAGSQATP